MSYNKTNKAKQRREWIRRFEVETARKNGNHMVYDVTSVLFPAGFPEAGTRLLTSKRFSQFQKLYFSLLQIHQKLHLKGDPPPNLPKTSYFNRFEPEVLEERRTACLNLLQHAGSNPILYSSHVFVSFLSNTTPEEEPTLSPSIKSDDDEQERIKENIPGTGCSSETETTNLIRSLTEKGDIMDATIHSTQLMGQHVSLPTPLTPLQSPIPPRPQSKIITEDPKSDTDNSTPIKNVQDYQAQSTNDTETVNDILPQYLSDAADSIGHAIQFESEENWEEAVSSYRKAIGTLLTSVQKDPCLKRQASVKRRISSYIEKAENLMQMEEIKETLTKNTPKKKLKASSKIPHLDLFGKSMLELRRYKVKKILSHQVLLVAVQHNYLSSLSVHQKRKLEYPASEPNGQEVVIKTMQKSSCVFRNEEDGCSKTSILPINVSYMTKLIRYYENDDFLHLVLEHIPGGELYKVIDHYFQKRSHPLQTSDKYDQIQESNSNIIEQNVNTGENQSFPVTEDSHMENVNQSSQISCPSPYGARSISVIKPSQSFINTRKKSLVRQVMDTFKSTESGQDPNEDPPSRCTFYVERPSVEKEGSISPSGSSSSMNYVCTYTDAYAHGSKKSSENDKLICINKEGIETIDCDTIKQANSVESFDFLDEFADETGQDAAKTIILKKTRLSSSVEENLDFSCFDLDEEEDSITATLNLADGEYDNAEIAMKLDGRIYSEPVKLVQDSKSLLASVSSKLAQRQSQSETAEKILSNLENVESKIHTHLELVPTSPMHSTLATPYEHTPAKLHPSLLFSTHNITLPLQKGNNPISPLSPSTVATTPTSMMSTPPNCSSSSSSEAASPSSNYSKETSSNTLKLWDLVPYYDHLNLKLTNCIPIGLIRKWSAQLFKALFSLHSRGIIVQDLRPCNLLLDLNGNIKLTYQCNWISVDKRVSIERLLDENDGVYCAPELGRLNSVTPAVDWWSAGVILYELYVGERFASLYPSGLLPHTPVQFDEGDLLNARKLNATEFNATKEEKRYEDSLRELISSFLKPLPEERLQNPEEIIKHSFFKGVNWENLKQLI